MYESFTTENIRNISLVGHRGSGKTTLIESLLYVKDYIKRKGDVENGTTVSDFDKEEVRRIFFNKYIFDTCRT